ncbi:MAG: hypothetical protein AAF544_04205 [Bacteroidota bacterium]
MKRLELFEFEDFQWLPNAIRVGITNLLTVLHRMFGTSEVLIGLIKSCREKIEFDRIVDLGSGSGGPMISVVSQFNQSQTEEEPLELVLTDKYPDRVTVDRINAEAESFVSYHTASVDAQHIEQTPKGLKTMVASFHHMQPSVARKILRSAEESKEPILIYEIAENNVPVLVWWLLLPISLAVLILMALFMTPFIRPLRAQQLVFTYLIPLIPLIYAWDGQASIMRTYTFEDIKSLLGEQRNPDYTWVMAPAMKKNGKKAGYYLFGY